MVFIDESNEVALDWGAFDDLICGVLESLIPLFVFFGRPED